MTTERAKTLRGAFVTAVQNERRDLYADIIRRYAFERGMKYEKAERILVRYARAHATEGTGVR